MTDERRDTIDFLNGLATGEKDKKKAELAAIDYLVALDEGGDVETARKKREEMEWEKQNPLFEN